MQFEMGYLDMKCYNLYNQIDVHLQHFILYGYLRLS